MLLTDSELSGNYNFFSSIVNNLYCFLVLIKTDTTWDFDEGFHPGNQGTISQSFPLICIVLVEAIVVGKHRFIFSDWRKFLKPEDAASTYSHY